MNKNNGLTINGVVAGYLRDSPLLKQPVEKCNLKLRHILLRAESIPSDTTRTAVIDFFKRISGARPITLVHIQQEIDKAFPPMQPLTMNELATASSLQYAFGRVWNRINDSKITIENLQNIMAESTSQKDDHAKAIATFCKFLDSLDMTIEYVKSQLDAMPSNMDNRESIVDAVQQILESHLKLLFAHCQPPIPLEQKSPFDGNALQETIATELNAHVHKEMKQLFKKKPGTSQ